MAKTKVLRPTVGAVVENLLTNAPKVNEVLRPESAGGHANMKDASVLGEAGKFVDLVVEIAEAKAALEKLEARQTKIEEWLLEQMQTGQTQRLTAKGRTVYIREDFIVSKSKGVTTDQVNDALRLFGLSDLIAEGYNAQTLKATVREMEERAKAAGFFVDLEYLDTISDPGDRAKAGEKRFANRCSVCGEFYPATGAEGAMECSKDHDAAPCYEVDNGVPLSMRQLLYIAKKPRLGCTK